MAGLVAAEGVAARRSIGGDENTGRFVPRDARPANQSRLVWTLLDRLAALPGLTATTAGVLVELGFPLAVASDILQSRLAGDRWPSNL